ncbi:PIN domain-containing protein [Sorangium sp. So ce388]|uniref:PIN domain-containing protein n=1 Tax=Sorangium sp. So ce388 TaxID=3133309 RepID=UPI003F5B1BDB
MRIVLDSSVAIASMKPAEPGHADALAFLERARAVVAAGGARVLAPAELWLEVYVAEQRLAASRASRASPARVSPQRAPAIRAPAAASESPLAGLAVELVAPADEGAIAEFLGLLTRRMRGRRPFANATDLVYLWAAHGAEATVVTLDEGLLKYHGVVCDVTRPQHVQLR